MERVAPHTALLNYFINLCANRRFCLQNVVVKPQGAFYLFAKCPCEPKMFFEECKKEGLLVVPSDSFGIKGYVRIAYCVPTDRIINSAPHFKEVAKKCGLVK